MDTYAQAERIELHGREVPFARRSEQSFQRVGSDVGVAELALDRDGTLEHRSGREGLKLMKLTGSSFEGFVRDEYTTLPSRATGHFSCTWTSTGATPTSGARGRRRSATSWR